MHRIFLITFLLICSLGLSHAQDLQSTLIIGEWKLVKNEAVDQIRSSNAYLSASPEKRLAMEERIKILLSSSYYQFKGDKQVNFTDLESGAIVQRQATYHIENNMLSIKEIDRDRIKKAKITQLDEKTLILAPIINGKEQEAKMIFEHWK
ncbi:lipocalin family protein [Echinicola marina]|uniref:lipocalin family protein n=1 Tax=Echinicola marina TaxID=2859768 RepID=UPI001CF70AA8|nr:lipocalin family protein [Echinicola marina]UCS94947.1 lipocalin family protein [Echinicola marina]